MDDFEDDINELSSIASYPSSLGRFSQNLLQLEDAINIPDINLESSPSQIASSQSVSLVPPGTPHSKGEQLTPRSWAWSTPEEPLGLLVEVRGIK